MAMMAAMTPPRWSWRPTRRSFSRQMHPRLRGLGMYRNGGVSGSNWAFEILPSVRKLKEVMSTEQPCDLAYEFGDGLHDIKELPLGFPRPVKHPYPFNDQIVVYVRYLGPGVSVGQAWQEGTKLEQVPHKLYGEILMVKDCTSLREDQ
ncbi:hypothetical protein glysoja_007125 [Glycine soja]|nr:hypothetical protein glysoja_007125 [Glycine soja]